MEENLSPFIKTLLELNLPDAVFGQVMRAYYKEEKQELLYQNEKEMLRKLFEKVQPKKLSASTILIISFLGTLGREIAINASNVSTCYEICGLPQPNYVQGHLLDLKNKKSYGWIEQDKSRGGFRLNSAGQAYAKGLLGDDNEDEE